MAGMLMDMFSAGAGGAVGAGLPHVTGEATCQPTSKRPRGSLCCRAATEFGAAAAARGFTYEDCHGVTRCATCTIVPSKSKRHPGLHVWQYRAKAGCRGGCAVLGNQ